MLIERSMTPKVFIVGAQALDAITVYPMTFEHGKCAITIICAERAWSAYWGCTGVADCEEFVANAPSDYIANRLVQGTVPPQRVDGYIMRIVDAVQAAFRNPTGG